MVPSEPRSYLAFLMNNLDEEMDLQIKMKEKKCEEG